MSEEMSTEELDKAMKNIKETIFNKKSSNYESETIGKIALALSKAQDSFEELKKTKTAKIKLKGGGEYSYSYADIGNVIACIKKALSQNEIAFIQQIVLKNEDNMLHTRLIHSSGEYLGCNYRLSRKASPQEFGSELTYARRYSICGLVGVAAEDDDDGKSANDAYKGNNKNNKTSQSTKPKFISPKQLEFLKKAMLDTKLTFEDINNAVAVVFDKDNAAKLVNDELQELLKVIELGKEEFHERVEQIEKIKLEQEAEKGDKK